MADSDVEMEESGEERQQEQVDGGMEKKPKVYIPGVSRPLKEGEQWEFDPDAYRIFRSFDTELPCLSFDIISDSLGEDRQQPPLSFYLAGGTQAAKVKNNELFISRFSNIHPIKKEKENDEDSGSSSSSSSEDEEEDEQAEEGGTNTKKHRKPIVHTATIPHIGDINRIKCQLIGSNQMCAVWNDLNGQGKVQLWSLGKALARLQEMDQSKAATARLLGEKPLFSFTGHTAPGFALGWSPLKEGALASGDNHKKIFLWQMGESGEWRVDGRPFTSHTGSIEDIQWSPTEEALLVSCSADRSIRLWDTRSPPQQACVCTVSDSHESDVNVLSWNREEPLIVSGGDDAQLKIWSLKTIQYNQPVALFKYHKGPITSVEWNPNDSTTLMAAGEDDLTTIWDLALESDTQQEGEEDSAEVEAQVPPQLLFVHMGQKEIKEVHWHRQLPGLAITTALDEFHVFRTINC